MKRLAADRLGTVAGALREGNGIDESRLVLVDPSGELAEGAPEVTIKLRPVKTLRAATAREGA